MRILSSFPNPFPFHNMALRQRLIFLSQHHELHFLTRQHVEIPKEFHQRTRVWKPPYRFANEYLDRIYYLLWASYMLFFKLRTRFFDVSYSFHELSSFFLGYLSKRRGLAAKWVIDYLDDPVLEYYNWSLREKPLYKKITVLMILKIVDIVYKIIFKLADLYIVQGLEPSDQLPRKLINKYGIRLERMVLVPNGVDLNGIKAPGIHKLFTNGYNIFFVGYVSKLRGIDLLLNVLERLLPVIPEAHLILVGWSREDDRHWLSQEVRARKLEKAVVYLGVQPSAVVWDLINQATVCVVPFQRPYLSYVYPVKIFEYLALERPVVASRLEGISRIIEDGVNGLLADPESVSQWTEALLRLYQDPKLAEKLVANARRSIEKYDWQIINNYINKKLIEISGQQKDKICP